MSAYQQQVDTLADTIRTQQININELIGSKQQLEASAKEGEMKMGKAAEESAAHGEVVSRLTAENSLLTQRIDALNASQHEMRQEMEKQFSFDMACMKDLIASMERERVAQVKALQKVGNEVSDLEAALQDARAGKDALEGEKVAAASIARQQEAKLAELQAEVAARQRQCNDVAVQLQQQQQSQLEVETTLRAEIQKLQQHVYYCQHQYQLLQHQYQIVQTQLDEALKEAIKIKADDDTSKQRFSSLIERHQAQERELKDKLAVMESMRRASAEQEFLVAALRKDLESLQQQCKLNVAQGGGSGSVGNEHVLSHPTTPIRPKTPSQSVSQSPRRPQSLRHQQQGPGEGSIKGADGTQDGAQAVDRMTDETIASLQSQLQRSAHELSAIRHQYDLLQQVRRIWTTHHGIELNSALRSGCSSFECVTCCVSRTSNS